MGLISNLFTESEFDDYRFIEKVLKEADNDDEDNFDMPYDDTGDNENQSGNTPEPEDDNASNDDNAGDESSDEDNFDMPDDTTDPQSDEGIDTQSMDNNPEPQSQSADTSETQSNDNTADGGDEDNFDLTDGDVQTQDNNGDGSTDNASGDDTGDMSGGDEDNFDMDDSTADGGDGSDDGMPGSDTGDMPGGGEDPDQDLKDAENDIFNGLSDQDKVIKINELKDLYQDLYNRIITLYDKVNDIPKDEELIKVYNFIIDNLSDLKQFVYDYLTNTFDNKTYLENMVNYKKYLSTLNVINGILEEIRKGLYK